MVKTTPFRRLPALLATSVLLLGGLLAALPAVAADSTAVACRSERRYRHLVTLKLETDPAEPKGDACAVVTERAVVCIRSPCPPLSSRTEGRLARVFCKRAPCPVACETPSVTLEVTLGEAARVGTGRVAYVGRDGRLSRYRPLECRRIDPGTELRAPGPGGGIAPSDEPPASRELDAAT